MWTKKPFKLKNDLDVSDYGLACDIGRQINSEHVEPDGAYVFSKTCQEMFELMAKNGLHGDLLVRLAWREVDENSVEKAIDMYHLWFSGFCVGITAGHQATMEGMKKAKSDDHPWTPDDDITGARLS